MKIKKGEYTIHSYLVSISFSLFLSLHVSDGLVTRVTPPTPVPGQSQPRWATDGHKSYTDL